MIWREEGRIRGADSLLVVGDLKPMLDDLLSSQNVAARGLFDVAEVKRLRRANDAGTEDNALRIWSLLTLELWQQQFLDQAVPRPPTRERIRVLPS